MARPSKKKQLRPLERQVLTLAQDGMLTVEIVFRRFYPTGDTEAARSILRRLIKLGYLQSEPLDARRVYFRLTPNGARIIGASRKTAQALKKQGKIQRYAVSWFIHADQPEQRVLLDPAEHPNQFPVSGHRLPRCPFYLERIDGRSRFGVVLVDHNAHQRRMAQKTVKLLGRFLRHGWFDTFIAQEAFVVAILTFSKYRKRKFQLDVPLAIAEHLRYPLSRLRPDPTETPSSLIDVHVIPQLDVLASQSQKKRKTKCPRIQTTRYRPSKKPSPTRRTSWTGRN